MEEHLLKWLRSNLNQSFESPRKAIFKTSTHDFKIMELDEVKEIVKIRFESERRPILPLQYWRFDVALKILVENKDKWTRLGTSIHAYDRETIEWYIQETARRIYPNRLEDKKSTPHVCDLIVLAGIAEYGSVINPKTGMKNQAVRLLKTI